MFGRLASFFLARSDTTKALATKFVARAAWGSLADCSAGSLRRQSGDSARRHLSDAASGSAHQSRYGVHGLNDGVTTPQTVAFLDADGPEAGPGDNSGHPATQPAGEDAHISGGWDRLDSDPLARLDLASTLELLIDNAALARAEQAKLRSRAQTAVSHVTQQGEQVELVEGTWEDIGVGAQMKWYEHTTADPLVHDASGCLIYLHSVHEYLPASYETAQALVGMVNPRVVAVQCDNNFRQFAEEVLPLAMEVAPDAEHVRKVASAYLNQLTGEVVSPHVRSAEEQDVYFQKARVIAQMYSFFDLHDALDRIAERGDPVELAKANSDVPLFDRVGDVLWAAVLHSGMLPQWEFHRPALDAIQAGRSLEFVGMPVESVMDFAREVVFPEGYTSAERESEADTRRRERALRAQATEYERATQLLHDFGVANLPMGVPEQLISRMALAVATPQSIVSVLNDGFKFTPGVMQIEEAEAEYVAKMLREICETHPSIQGRTEPTILCLVNRNTELLIRRHWDRICPSKTALPLFEEKPHTRLHKTSHEQVEVVLSPELVRKSLQRRPHSKVKQKRGSK